MGLLGGSKSTTNVTQSTTEYTIAPQTTTTVPITVEPPDYKPLADALLGVAEDVKQGLVATAREEGSQISGTIKTVALVALVLGVLVTFRK